MRKLVLLTTLVVSIFTAGFITTNKIYAETTTTELNPMQSLVKKISTRFGLDETEVQAIFDEDRTEKQQRMRGRFEEKLNQDVIDGKITKEKQNLITAKRAELETARSSRMQEMQNLTEEERIASRETRRTENEAERESLKVWAEENGIDMHYLISGFGRKGPGGIGMFGGPPKEATNN